MRPELNKNIKKFVHENRIKVVETTKRKAVPDYLFTDYRFDYKNEYLQEVYSEPIYCLELAERDLEFISNIYAASIDSLERYGEYNPYMRLMYDQETEKELRRKNAALKKAYDHYQLLLKMAKSDIGP